MGKQKNTAFQQAKGGCKFRGSVYMLIFFIVSATLFGQTDKIRFKHLSVVDGLSQEAVNCIIQDRRGFMWFGTQDGLNRYDGYNFKVYKNDPNDNFSISDKYILCLYEDREGNLWIGTRNGGLNRYDRASENFINYKNDLKVIPFLGDYDVQTIGEGLDGDLWVGTQGGGLLRMDKKENQFKKAYKVMDGLSDDYINAVFIDSNGRVWIGTRKGLDYFDQTSGGFLPCNIMISGTKNSLFNVTAIFEEAEEEFWVGTADGKVFRLAGQGGRPQYEYNVVKKADLAGYNPIRCLFKDTEGILWIGTQRRLIRLNPENGESTEYENDVSDNYSLNNNEVLSIYRDKTGIIWLGTYGGGLNIYDSAIHRFKLFNKERNNLSQNLVWAILKDSKGRLWIGTYGGGLNLFDQNTGKFCQYLEREDVRCIYEDKYTGRLWIGTFKNGLLKFNPETGQIEKNFPFTGGKEGGMSDKGVICILQTHPDEMWLGTFAGGLVKFSPMTRNFAVYKHIEDDPKSLSNDYVRAILKDKDGNLWVGTDGGGLNLLEDPATGVFRHYLNDKNNPLSLSHNRIKSIYQDKSGRIWIGTEGGGLNLLVDKEKGQFKAFGLLTQGVPNETVYGILEDEQGNLWMSTTSGLFKFSLKPGSTGYPIIKNYDYQDGLQSNEFDTGAYFKNEKTGEMFFGGGRGLNSLFPQDIKDDPNKPPAILTDFLLFNKSIGLKSKWNYSPLKKGIDETQSITLSYRQNVMTFEFAALSYANPLKNRYKYKMDGYDRDWLETDAKNRRATYTGLPAGEYTFMVKGSNKDGVWSNQDASIKLKILPPPWKTGWAYTLYAIVTVFILYLIWAAWSKRFLKRKVEEQTQKLKDSQDHLIQSEKMAAVGKLLAGIAHELNNPASFIKMNSEFFARAWKDIVPLLDRQAQSDNDFEIAGLVYNDSKADIAKLIPGLIEGSTRIKNLIEELKQFSRKEEPLKKDAVDINRVLQSSIDLTRHEIGKATNSFSYDLEDGLPVIYGNFQGLERVFINLIQNACQALTHNSQGIYISTAYDRDNNCILVKVKDEGKGIEEEILKNIAEPFITTKRESGGMGLGLSISSQIIHQHGGTMNFESTPGKGTTVSVHLPVHIEGKKGKP